MEDGNNNKLCRLCGETKPTTINVFDEQGQKLSIDKKVIKCLQIKIEASDSLPVSVCITCWELLEQYNHFHDKTNKAQISLAQLLTTTQDFSQVLIDENKYESAELLPSESNRLSENEIINDEINIPDNYMTGTESDIEIIKGKKKRGKLNEKEIMMERYPWLCTDCNDKLASLELLKEHHKTVHNQPAKYMCIHCWKYYNEYNSFLTHVKRHNNNKYCCNVCKKLFSNKTLLESHCAMDHSDKRPFICQTCGKGFRHQSGLHIHSRCHLPETMKNKYPCDDCGKVLSTKPNLVTHRRIHSGVKNFQCDMCGKGFLQKGNLEAHFLTHSLERPFNCTQCTKTFKTPLQLKKHETVHSSDIKPHKCSDCGKTFREKGTLREHYRIHTGAKPFTCEVCGKAFRFKGILTTHKRQHTGERPYSCLECNHNFSNWPNYNKHMKRRHGINTSTKQSTNKNLNLQQEKHIAPVQQQQQHVEQPINTVQIIQSQPIVLQALPTITTTNIPVFHIEHETDDDVIFNSNRDTTTYLNPVPTSLQTSYLPSNIPYNFYSGANMSEGEMILPK